MNTMNTNTEEWGNIELPGLSDEQLFKKNWNWIAGARQRNQDPTYLESTKKGLEKRSSTTWKENQANSTRISAKNPIHIETRKQSQRKVNGFPVCAIEPNGTIHQFNSIAECAEKLDNWVLQSKSSIYFPIDGSRYKAQRRKWKDWIFYRLN
jgi:hypothetical protein